LYFARNEHIITYALSPLLSPRELQGQQLELYVTGIP